MTKDLRPIGALTDDEVRTIVSAAAAAPSLHNSQPWHFHCTPTTIEVHADLTRALPATDPDHRELMLACGAALVNLRVAIRVLGVAADVRLLPDPSRPSLLAIVRPDGFTRATTVDHD